MYKANLQSEPMKKKKAEKDPKSVPFPMRLEAELLEDLRKLAEADERTISDYARRVLRQHVAKELKK